MLKSVPLPQTISTWQTTRGRIQYFLDAPDQTHRPVHWQGCVLLILVGRKGVCRSAVLLFQLCDVCDIAHFPQLHVHT